MRPPDRSRCLRPAETSPGWAEPAAARASATAKVRAAEWPEPALELARLAQDAERIPTLMEVFLPQTDRAVLEMCLPATLQYAASTLAAAATSSLCPDSAPTLRETMSQRFPAALPSNSTVRPSE